MGEDEPVYDYEPLDTPTVSAPDPWWYKALVIVAVAAVWAAFIAGLVFLGKIL